MAISKDKIENDMLDTMFAFLQMGTQKGNYPLLKDYCLQLLKMMTQKTAGQPKYRPKGKIPFENLERVKNGIIIEAMALVLSGELESFYSREVSRGER